MRVVWVAIALCSLLGIQHVMAGCENRYKIGVHFNLYHDFVTVEENIQNYLSSTKKAKSFLKTASCGVDYKGVKVDYEVECEILKIREKIASNEPHREKGNECLDLVVSTEMHWNETEYAQGQMDFSAYLELANILQEHGIKMSLSLGVQSVPSWVAETKYANDQLEHTNDLRYKPDSPMWKTHAKPWLEAAINKFSEKGYIGPNKKKLIQEIMIGNEVMFTEESVKKEGLCNQDDEDDKNKRCIDADEQLAGLFHKLYGYVQTALKSNTVPISWRLAYGAFGNPYSGINPDKLFNDNLPGFFAINVYEGCRGTAKIWDSSDWYTSNKLVQKENGCTWEDDEKYKDCLKHGGDKTSCTSEHADRTSDFYAQAIHRVKQYQDNNKFIYFSEFNEEGGVGSLPFERVILRTKKDGVTHWAFFGWNVGGVYNITPEEKKGLKTAFGLFFFSDVGNINSNAMNAIAELVLMGVIDGNDDGTFAPKRLVNRAEFSKMVVLAAEMPLLEVVAGEKVFPDVVMGSWYEQYVKTLSEKKVNGNDEFVVEGYDDGTFMPEKTINFAEAAKIVTLGFDLKPRKAKEGNEKWYARFVECANNLQILSPMSESELSEFATREQTALMIYNALKTTGNCEQPIQ